MFQTILLDFIHRHRFFQRCATSRKIAGSSSNEVDFFNLRNPSSRTMVLGLTQPLTETSTRKLPRG
jgi:hypothetical protein